MSASFVVLLPLILLGIVSVFCFTGCAFQTGGLGVPFSDYSNLTVLGNPAIVAAYWPLGETAGLTAFDYSGFGHNGAISNNMTLGVAGPRPPSHWPADQLPASPHSVSRIGNVGNGRASQFQMQENANWIIGTPATDVSLFPSELKYS